jgi:Na+-driven multidrug efflux pump
MIVFALASHIAPPALVGIFTNDPAVIAIGEEYVRSVSWNYVASGLICVASSMFQAMGNTLPSLIASVVRLVLIAVPAAILSRLPGFQLNNIWYLSVAAVFVQLAVSMSLLSREFGRRLNFAHPQAKAA